MSQEGKKVNILLLENVKCHNLSQVTLFTIKKIYLKKRRCPMLLESFSVSNYFFFFFPAAWTNKYK